MSVCMVFVLILVALWVLVIGICISVCIGIVLTRYTHPIQVSMRPIPIVHASNTSLHVPNTNFSCIQSQHIHPIPLVHASNTNYPCIQYQHVYSISIVHTSNTYLITCLKYQFFQAPVIARVLSTPRSNRLKSRPALSVASVVCWRHPTSLHTLHHTFMCKVGVCINI